MYIAIALLSLFLIVAVARIASNRRARRDESVERKPDDYDPDHPK